MPAAAALTVVGLAKNTGKTVAMNGLQQMLNQEGRTLGLLSIGLDGERVDALTRLPKPAVVVQPGTLVATAQSMIGSLRQWELLRETAIHTPVGRIVLLRARGLQKVVLAGPSKNHEVRCVLRELAVLGANCVLVDGAFDRQSSVDPSVSEQALLASGATLSRDLNRLVMLTKCRVQQLTLAECDSGCRALMGQGTARIKLVSGKRVDNIEVPTTLLSANEWSCILSTGCESLLLRGAAGDGLAEALLKSPDSLRVVVQDGSKIFIQAELWKRLGHKGVSFSAEKAIRLLGVTVNPVLPGGVGYDPDELLTALGRELAPLPVIDMVREVKYGQEDGGGKR